MGDELLRDIEELKSSNYDLLIRIELYLETIKKIKEGLDGAK